ncbi:hypothetical protein OB905_00595 [Halobacteria archaeon AArc-dxtr1]|nr:hypothetical protein [Halobacteria archaeon AArc-dxtr1]
MEETVDLQGQAIAIGILVAGLLLAYGAIISPTVAGYETFTLALWALAGTFGLVALVHYLYGRSDMALAYTGAAFGWVLILLSDGGFRSALGLLLLGLGGVYIVRLTLAEREAASSE